jgi:hypothetical protein
MGGQSERLGPKLNLLGNQPTIEKELSYVPSPLSNVSLAWTSVIGGAVLMSLGTVALFASMSRSQMSLVERSPHLRAIA